MKFQVYQFLLYCIFALFSVTEARIGEAQKEVSVSPDEDRDLAYYGQNNYNGRYYGGGGNGNGNGNDNGSGNSNVYGNGNGNGGRNYRRYYYNNGRYYGRYYNQNSNGSNENYNAVDDAVDADDNEVETYYNETEDTGNATTWRGYISSLESEAELRFFEWYQAPPGEWTTEQWAWFSGIISLTLGLLFCLCMCCSSCCESEKEKNREDTAYNFDDYTSIDSRKQSFVTKSSESTDFDDNATYDSIMRLRSD